MYEVLTLLLLLYYQKTTNSAVNRSLASVVTEMISLNMFINSTILANNYKNLTESSYNQGIKVQVITKDVKEDRLCMKSTPPES